MHIIEDLNSLHEFLPKKYLPAELGGTLPLSKDNLQEMTKTRLRATEKNIDEEFGSKPDESKRIGPKLSRDSAISDSFKKIQID